MKDAAKYLAQVKALIVMNPQIMHWAAAREEAQGDAGLFRYKLMLRDGSVLEMFENFRIVQETVKVTKYGFHWQDSAGRLRMRWDNASHHPEVASLHTMFMPDQNRMCCPMPLSRSKMS